MKTPALTRHQSFEAIDPWPANGALNVAAIYEEFAAGIRLKEALISLERSLGHVRVVNKAWSFSMLARLDVRAAAIHEAVDADILIVVTIGDQALPVQVIRWLERCLVESSGGPAALVELHDDILDEKGTPTAPNSKMVEIAGRWQKNLVTSRQFDDWLNADNIREIIRKPGPAFEFSDS